MTKTKSRARIYVFTEIDGFDARKGYTKCPVPGVGAHIERGKSAVADFWRNRAGHVVVRFASQGYRSSFEVRLADGGSVPDRQFEDFTEHVGELVHLWLVEGVDDVPSTEL
jgi:hypothetical protein